jgi:hypothetical protein
MAVAYNVDIIPIGYHTLYFRSIQKCGARYSTVDIYVVGKRPPRNYIRNHVSQAHWYGTTTEGIRNHCGS